MRDSPSTLPRWVTNETPFAPPVISPEFENDPENNSVLIKNAVVAPLIRPELLADKGALKKLLKHHIVAGRYDALTLLQNSPTLKDLDGHDLKAVKTRGIDYLRIDGSVLIGSNFRATNGIVHVLNDVIWPGVVIPVNPKQATRVTTTPATAPAHRSGQGINVVSPSTTKHS